MAIAQVKGGIRAAQTKDLHQIMDIVRQAVAGMRAEGSDQWNEEYPATANFAADIAEGSLFVDADMDEIRGVVCLNHDEPPQYLDIPWVRDAKALVIHRMAVGIAHRGTGVVSRLMDHAETRARQLGLNYIRSDTYSLNPRMNAVFEKRGYVLRGHTRFEGRSNDFNCWDKVLV